MMEEMKKESVICILLIVIVASCSSLRDINSQPFQNTPAPTATLTRAATSTSTITLEPLATSDFSQTPLPTLSSENSSRTVQVLMETNGGCRLPCWWGILPGKTSWQSAEKYLSSITTSIYESAGATPDTRRIEMLFPAPYPFDSEFRQVYRVKHDFVDRIEILPQDFSKYSLPEGMLNELDTPDMIFLGGRSKSLNPSNWYYIIRAEAFLLYIPIPCNPFNRRTLLMSVLTNLLWIMLIFIFGTRLIHFQKLLTLYFLTITVPSMILNSLRI
jgi:hypothetical protein